MDTEIVLVKQWIQEAVIGLNLCPFARPVYDRNQIFYIVSKAKDPESLLKVFHSELHRLEKSSIDEVATTIWILPTLPEFEDFLDIVSLMDSFLDQTPLRGVYQLASFHPQYQFEGTETQDLQNFTNRAPYPIIHIIREEDITRAAKFFGDTSKIPETNIRTLEDLGQEKVKNLFKRFSPSTASHKEK